MSQFSRHTNLALLSINTAMIGRLVERSLSLTLNERQLYTVFNSTTVLNIFALDNHQTAK